MQVKVFGGYTRWFSDIAPPHEALPGRLILSTIDTAVRMATAAPSPGEDGGRPRWGHLACLRGATTRMHCCNASCLNLAALFYPATHAPLAHTTHRPCSP
jgi:hypothetical protein